MHVSSYVPAQRRALSLTTALSMLVALAAAVPAVRSAPAAASPPPPPAVTDVGPNAVPGNLWGGRVERLAVNPVDSSRVFAATELGGLWRSTDGGDHWSHVDAVPLLKVEDVAYAPDNSNLVIAVGDYEGSTTSRGGVWRSTDGGTTWSKPAGSDPTCLPNGEPSALAVAIGAGSTITSIPVYVGDVCGLARSTSGGAGGTWTRVDPDGSFTGGGASHQVEDVEVRPAASAGQTQVDVCGPQGFFRSDDSGGTWSTADGASPTFRPATSPNVTGGAFGPCDIDTAPGNPAVVYLSNFEGSANGIFCAGQVLENRSGGAAGAWTQMGADVTDANCRDPFVQTHDDQDTDASTYHVYVGTSVRTLRQTCDSDRSGPSCLTGAANWPRWDANTPHTDPTGVVFDPALPNGCPVLLSGDGGVFRVTGGCGATPAIAPANTGLHAYDASETATTVWPDHTDLYFGTQDDGVFGSTDSGTTWTNTGPDVYNALADRTGGPGASVLTRPCFGCGIARFGPGLTPTAALAGPPAPWNAQFGFYFAGTQFGPGSYAFVLRDAPDDDGVPPAEPAPHYAVWYTTDVGAHWTQLGANLPGAPSPYHGPASGAHGSIRVSGSSTAPVFYLNLGGRLYRLTGGTLDNSQASNPATLTPLGTGAGTIDAWNVDPTDPTRLYAVSGNLSGIYRSTSGGADWQLDDELTSLVTSGGYKYRSSIGDQAMSIGFSPGTDEVMVGTLSNGLFASLNGGDDWLTVRGSKQIPRILDISYDDVRGTAYVGSRGRGIWRVDLPESDLRITKTDSPDPAVAGEQVTYTVRVTNDGPEDASGVTVVDDLPDQVEFLTSSTPCTEQTVSSHDRVTCELGDVPNGTTRTFTLTVLVDRDAVSSAGGTLTMTNTAKVLSSDTADRDPADNTATATTVVNDSADLQVTKLCDPASLRAGQSARCTVYVDDHGPSDARGVVLSDQLTSNGTFTVSGISAPNGGTCGAPAPVPGGQRFECQLGTVTAATTADPGRKTVTYTVTANDAQQIDNKARARSDTPDPDDTNNIATATVAVTAVADLSLTKSAPASVTAGQSMTYALSLANGGPSVAEGVTVADTLPEGVSVVSVSGSGGASCTSGVPGDPRQPTTCSFGSLPSGATRSMTVQVAVLPGTTGSLRNDARVSSSTFDPDSSDDLASTTTAVTTSADLSVTKTATPEPATAGRPLSYSLRVDNAGPSVARDVALVDSLPAGFTWTDSAVQHGSGTCVTVTGTPTQVRCQLGSLGAADYVVVAVNGVVKTSVPSGQVLRNTATVSSTTPDPVPSNGTAVADTTVRTSADLALAHTSDASVYKPSTVVHYAITVTNLGPSDAVNVVITDLLPPAKYGSYVNNDGGCTVSGQTMTCPGVTLPYGASRTVLVNFSVQGSKGTVQATASVTSATPDPSTANNSQTRTVTRK